MSDIRVLVVDDHAVVRSGLRLLLEREPGIVPVDEAANAEEAIFRMIEHKPDVLLIDEPATGLDTATATQVLTAIRQQLPRAVLVLAMHELPPDPDVLGSAWSTVVLD